LGKKIFEAAESAGGVEYYLIEQEGAGSTTDTRAGAYSFGSSI